MLFAHQKRPQVRTGLAWGVPLLQRTLQRTASAAAAMRETVLFEAANAMRLWGSAAEHSMHFLIVGVAAAVAKGTFASLGPIPLFYLLLALGYWRLRAIGRMRAAAWTACIGGFALQLAHNFYMCWLRVISFSRPLEPQVCILMVVGWLVKGLILGAQAHILPRRTILAFGTVILTALVLRCAFVRFTLLPEEYAHVVGEGHEAYDDGWLVEGFVCSPIWPCGAFLVGAALTSTAKEVLLRRLSTCSSIAYSLELEAYSDEATSPYDGVMSSDEAGEPLLWHHGDEPEHLIEAGAALAAPAPRSMVGGHEEEWLARGPKECVICLDRSATHAFIPCGHRCVCDRCGSVSRLTMLAGDTTKCPLCRERSTQVLRIFD